MNKIIQLVNQASDVDLMKSRFNCHLKGLHSIVLEDNGGSLTRCFLAEKSHNLHSNDRHKSLMLSLGVHNHRYSLEIEGVTGSAVNYTFVESSMGVGCKCYRFYNKDEVELLGNRSLMLKKQIELTDGRLLLLGKNDLHTVFVPRREAASWIVVEGLEEADHTNLYTNSLVKCEGHCSPNSPQFVRDFVRRFFCN